MNVTTFYNQSESKDKVCCSLDCPVPIKIILVCPVTFRLKCDKLSFNMFT